MDRPEFDASVHEALAHLYDLPFLQRSPLVDVLGLRKRDGGGGTALHRALIEAIDQLKPSRDVSPEAVAWKTYRSLHLRYVRSMNATAAARELGLSTRQAQRIHFVALASIATLLWERWPIAGKRHQDSITSIAAISRENEEDRTLDDELATVLEGERGELEPFLVTLRGALKTMGPILEQRRISLDLTIDEALSHGIAPHDLARQALMQLFLGIIDRAGPGKLIVVGRRELGGAQIEISHESSDQLATRPVPGWGLDQHLRVAGRLLAALGGEFSASPSPRYQLRAALPLDTAPTVLTVEDNPQVVQLFRRYLSGSMFRLIHAPDPDAVIQLARETQPDVITLDVMMPRRDGWELLQALKVRPETQHIPVLVCSVLRDQELAMALGAADFLVKPVTQQVLLDALHRHLPAHSTVLATPDRPASG